jgi:hypothetical protein
MVPVFYSTTLPVMFGISLFVIAYEIRCYFKNRSSFVELLVSFVPIITIFIIVILSKFQTISSIPSEFYIYSFKTYFIFFIETLIKVFFESFPVILFGIYGFIKLKWRLFLNFWFILCLTGLFFGFIYIYIHPRGILNLDQALSNISPVLVLIIFVELIISSNFKINKLLVLAMIFIGFMNLTFYKRNSDYYVFKKQIPTLSSDFKNKVRNFYKMNNFKVISCSIWNNAPKTVYPLWSFDSENVFQDIFNERNINLPLELGYLGYQNPDNFDYTLKFFENHPYFSEFKRVTSENVLFFLMKKKVNALFISDPSLVSPKILFHFKKIFQDRFSRKSFWILKKSF